MLTQDQMNLLVPERLREIERAHGVKVLHAVETGSRAWGIASPDSDFDVRFIYVRPNEDYLRLNAPRDVIETPIDDTWDVSGWDLQKALKLLYKSNPSLYEWMASDMTYIDSDFADRLAPLLKPYFEKKAMMYHYYPMASNNVRAFLSGPSVKPKKYFYALRPILACMWIRAHDFAPPIRYADLVADQLPASLRTASDHLLELKIHAPEKAEIAPIPEVDAYIRESLDDLGAYLKTLPDYQPADWTPLNAFFLSELQM